MAKSFSLPTPKLFKTASQTQPVSKRCTLIVISKQEVVENAIIE